MSSCRRDVSVLLLLGTVACSGLWADEDGDWKAIVVNGGADADSNWASHRTHLHRMVDTLEGRGLTSADIQVLASDGSDPTPDLTVLAPPPDPGDIPGWLVVSGPVFDPGGPLAHLLPQPQRVDTGWTRTSVAPATRAHLEAALVAANLSAGDTLLLTTTDHGGPDGSLDLWHETLAADGTVLAEVFALVPADVRVLVVMSQCHSGAFARPLLELRRSLGLDICGVFSVPDDRQATGCFPETDGKEVGHAFDIAAALASEDSLDAAHRQVLVADRGPDVPIRTSDVWLWDRIVDEVGADATSEQLAAWVDQTEPPQSAEAQALRAAIGVPVGGLADLHTRTDLAIQSIDEFTLLADSQGWARLDLAVRVQQTAATLEGPWPERLSQAAKLLGVESRRLRPNAAAAEEGLWTASLHEAGIARLGWLTARESGLSRFGRDDELQAILDCESTVLPGTSVPLVPASWSAPLSHASPPNWLGVRVEESPLGPRVVAVHPDGPVSELLRVGDVIAKVDGQPTPLPEVLSAHVLAANGSLELGLADGRTVRAPTAPLSTRIAPVVPPDLGASMAGVLDWLDRPPAGGAQLAVFVGPHCPGCDGAVARGYDWAMAAGIGIVVIEDAESARLSGATTDPGGFVADAFGITVYPSVVAIDEEARVLWRVDGWEPGAGVDLPPVP